MIDNNMLALLQNLYEAVYIVDKNRKIIFWNSNCEDITGYSDKEVINKHCYNNILQHVDENGKNLCHDGCPLHATLEDGEIRENLVYLRHKKGYRVPVNVKTFPVYDENGNIDSCVEVFNHAEYYLERKDNVEKLKKEAYIDALTNIPNRRYIEMFLNMKIDDYLKYEVPFEVPFAVIFFDIDNFKSFNDTYGHDIGDEILKLVSKTLSSSIRNIDFIGRFGGEEFLMILFGFNEEKLDIVANKYRTLVQNSYIITEAYGNLSCTISMGATIVNKGDTFENIIKRADSLMYEAKKSGKNKVIIG